MFTGSQKRHLRGLGHDLDPVVQIGVAGLTGAVLAEIDQALEAHELIKVKLGKNAPLDVKSAAGQISVAMGAVIAQTIGRVILLYREAEDPDMRTIRIPKPRVRDDQGPPAEGEDEPPAEGEDED